MFTFFCYNHKYNKYNTYQASDHSYCVYPECWMFRGDAARTKSCCYSVGELLCQVLVQNIAINLMDRICINVFEASISSQVAIDSSGEVD